MCGRCRHVFNAFESLKRIDDENALETVDYSLVDSSHPRPEEIIAPDEGAGAAIEQSAVDSIETDRSTEQWTEHLNLPPAPHAPPPTELTDAVIAHADVVEPMMVADDMADKSTSPAGHLVAPVEDSISSVAEKADDAEHAKAIFAKNNPLINGAVPKPRGHGNSILWGALTSLGGIIFSLQVLYFYRSEVVQQFPPLRPYLLDACKIVGCTVPWGRDQSAIKIEASDLIEPPGKPGRILLTATIANRGSTPQDFPSLDVKLIDASNVVLASRIFTPGEYLGRTPSAAESIAANAEIYVNLNLELIGKAPATGYALQAFYP